MPEKREPTMWGVNDAERLEHEDRDEAIYDYLDANYVRAGDPATVTLQGYVRCEVNSQELADQALETLLEDLDEQYADPEGEDTKATDAMKAAAKVFVDAVLSEYEVYTCELVFSEEVDVSAWIQEHQPGWLEKSTPPVGQGLPQ